MDFVQIEYIEAKTQSANTRETIERVLQGGGTVTSLGLTNIWSVVVGSMKDIVNLVFTNRNEALRLRQNLTRARD